MQLIKLKITIGFFTSLVAIALAGYFAYTSFFKLADSVIVLSKPDHTVKLLNEVINNLVESENEMRMYTITADDRSLDIFIFNMEEIRDILDTLRLNAVIAVDSSKVDTLSELLQSKANLMYELVRIKKDPGAKQLASKAMNKISNTITENEKIAKEYSDSVQITEPGIKKSSLPQISSTEEKKSNKLLDFFKLNNKKNKKNQPAQDTLPVVLVDSIYVTEAKIENDKNILQSNQTISPDDLRNILTELNKDEKQYEHILSNQELDILASDKIIMGEIREIIRKAESFQEQTVAANVQTASNNAEQSSKVIFGISILALLAGLIFLLIIINDINKSNKYKRELEVARDAAEYHAKAKELFLANMSHEIRTPLNAIIGFSEQLEETPLRKEQDDYVQAVRGASEHLLNIVNDILDLTKIEAGKIVIQKNVFAVSEVIAEVAHIMQVKANEKNIGLEFFYDDQSKELIRGDDFRLKQILYNLIGNAIKFTHKGFVKITCNSLVNDPYINFSIDIKDSGIGIPENKLKTIFEDFTQADDSTTKKYGGTGLGLSISRKLIELQQGMLTVTSTENEGSVFTVHLRYRIPSEKQIAAHQKGEKVKKVIPKNINVLLVDDEPFNLALAAVIFKKYNIDNTCVASPLEAMRLFSEDHYDIVFADIHMPEEDGFTFARKLRNIHPHIPILALTANVMHDERKLLSASGFNDIVLKPYKEQEILDKIIHWVKKGNAGAAEIDHVELKHDAEQEQEEMLSEKEKLYSLEEIKLFSDNDDQLIAAVIQSFVESNTRNIEVLAQHCEQQHIEGINNVAHKMLPGYNHFKVFSLIPVLKKLEILTVANPAELQEALEKITAMSQKIFVELLHEMQLMEERAPV